ncbi:TadE/TadG family type IV pilus assembly protein [Maritimibacter sp. DP1N21-5]|uniref:TadE/TadG family type IV pilus assembly protein n=1 Tax=Maritimibacter sp. DP1N21-5 TaxID=2836867 RepID=UPI001C442E87|nr:TadE/TadG family type IV pilus assembly protein [Maritimibacter sp. DP1N21-5]MBV7410191.1 pilus assembly protein [Maritimibacter sp. DP1N21-5]
MRRGAGIKKRIGQIWKREEGNATIEFVILFPAIMTLFLSAFEISIYLARSVLLERALDISVRQLRLGTLAPKTAAELRDHICNGTLIFPDCIAATTIELTPISTSTWQFPANTIACVDRNAEIQPAMNVNFGQANDVMIVRACTVLDPFFATTPWVMGLPLDASGGYNIAAASTFVNEP